ncbi:hypothetical protein BpHYR1_035958 [Brachionus plicatilis]|uniref:Uncharacterized protein n=1 Tax=Brachionus plicatilis TaxID=10195 RepID=A0A3M7Q8B2_BRAPC|nr:hypothetical protein BpHYR1_035958 [Brachionus plicatilis]
MEEIIDYDENADDKTALTDQDEIRKKMQQICLRLEGHMNRTTFDDFRSNSQKITKHDRNYTLELFYYTRLEIDMVDL